MDKMQDLFLRPERLGELAVIQDQAHQAAQEMKLASPTEGHVFQQLQQTHGVFFSAFFSNDAIAYGAVEQRNRAIGKLITHTEKLGTGLRAARDAYQGVDEQMGANLDRSVCLPDKIANLDIDKENRGDS